MPAASPGFLHDGFDAYNGAGAGSSSAVGLGVRWAFPLATPSTPLPAGRFGGHALSPYNSSFQFGYATLQTGISYTSATMGAAIIGAQAGTTFTLLGFLLNGSGQFSLVFNTASQVLSIISGTSGATFCSSVALGPILVSWHYFEISVVVASGAGGSVFAYLDGVLVCSATGINTAALGASVNGIFLGCVNASGNAINYHDDFYFNPSVTPLGPMRCPMLRASADSAVAWTPNSGANNYSRVNETDMDGDTSYVSASANGTSDLYTFGLLPTTPSTIFDVAPVMAVRGTDANPRGVEMQISSSSTLDRGSAGGTSNAYGFSSRSLLVDPNTGLAWTASAVNSVLAGPYLDS